MKDFVEKFTRGTTAARFIQIGVGAIALLAVSGCAPREPAKLPPRIVRENPPPGTVREPWHEPMPDVVEVPDQLDPTGTYYLPKHKQVIEVRPNRYRETDYGEGKK